MSKVESRLEELGISLPDSPAPIANYVPVVRTGNLIYLSGIGPTAKPDGSAYIGKINSQLTIEEGYDAARLTAVNMIARLKGYLGDLDRVVQIVKVLSMVNADLDFTEPPAVTNGCSDLLVEVFGGFTRLLILNQSKTIKARVRRGFTRSTSMYVGC